MEKQYDDAKVEQQAEQANRYQDNQRDFWHSSRNQGQGLMEKNFIVFSLNRLRLLISAKEIQHLDMILNQKSKQEQCDGYLQFVPYKAFPAIREYLGQKHRCPTHQTSPFPNPPPFSLPKSPTQLSTIAFPNLLMLNLSSQQIDNIQALTFFFAPKLRLLQLYDNKISNMDSLIKADFPSLETITFYLNTINKMEQFYRFHSKKLRTYEFDCFKHHTIPFEDYRFLFKMENPVPLKIRVTNRNRINIKQRPYFDTLTQTGAKIIFYDKFRSNLRLRI